MLQPDHRDSRPIYEQISQRIRHQIRTGILQPGEKLPSVRELASTLSINPNTIQRSYRELENEGWICSIPGKGSFVCQTGPEITDHSALLIRFEETARALLAEGVSLDDLINRLNTIGGEENA